MKLKVSETFNVVILIGVVCLVQSSPVKVSRPQAITATNLTDDQVKTLIQENPTRPSILQTSDQFLPPSIPLYLPDPERNKSKDDFYLLATYTNDDKLPESSAPSLDTYMRPPPLPNLDTLPFNFNSDASDKDKSSYSYNNRYDYYFPMKVVYDDKQKYGDQEVQLMEMQPPVRSDEPNYYAIKPKKVPKKYQPNKKDVNHSKSNGHDDGLIPIDNDGLILDGQHTSFVTSQPVERFVPAPSYRDLTDDDLNTGEFIPKYTQDAISFSQNTGSSKISTAASNHNSQKFQSGEANANAYRSNENDDNDQIYDYEKNGMTNTDDTNKRIEFQMHGFDGPNSYKFGYDTGFGKGRQFRIEQRGANGSVIGKYGYIDDNGKMHMTKYKASIDKGFQAEEIST